MTEAPLEYLMRRVHINTTTGCWEWTRSPMADGYAAWRAISIGTAMAHRAAYELLRGLVPEGLHLDHLCRVRHCVNPWHLEAVTCRENTKRSTNHVARNIDATHCIRGHAFTPDNTYRNGDKRKCRACCRIREQEKRMAS